MKYTEHWWGAVQQSKFWPLAWSRKWNTYLLVISNIGWQGFIQIADSNVSSQCYCTHRDALFNSKQHLMMD